MSHLKTYDVQPPVDAVPKRADLSSQKGLPEGGGSSDLPAPDFDRAVRIWGCLRRGVWTRAETLRELKYLEAGLAACDSCRLRSATINHLSDLICGECDAAGRRWRDAVDRGWETYRDEVGR